MLESLSAIYGFSSTTLADSGFIGNSVDPASSVAAAVSSAYTAMQLPADVIVIINAVMARIKVLFFSIYPPEIVLFKRSFFGSEPGFESLLDFEFIHRFHKKIFHTKPESMK